MMNKFRWVGKKTKCVFHWVRLDKNHSPSLNGNIPPKFFLVALNLSQTILPANRRQPEHNANLFHLWRRAGKEKNVTTSSAFQLMKQTAGEHILRYLLIGSSYAHFIIPSKILSRSLKAEFGFWFNAQPIHLRFLVFHIIREHLVGFINL